MREHGGKGIPSGVAKSFSNGSASARAAKRIPRMRERRGGAMFGWMEGYGSYVYRYLYRGNGQTAKSLLLPIWLPDSTKAAVTNMRFR